VKILIFIFFLFLIYTPLVLAATISINGGQQSITANDEYTVAVTLSIENSTNYYLRGVFYKPNTSHYCGYTWNGSSWFKGPYSSNNGWTNFLQVTTKNNSWSGQLKAKIDLTDSACSGGGAYNFKVERFTQGGTRESDTQNEQTVNVVVATPTLAATPPDGGSPTVSPTLSPTSTSEQDPASPAATDSVSTQTLFQPSSTPIPTPTTSNSDQNNSGQTDSSTPAVSISSASGVVVPTDESVLGFQLEPTSTGLSNDTPGLPAKKGIPSWVWYLLFMGAVLLMAGCGIVLFQIKKKR